MKKVIVSAFMLAAVSTSLYAQDAKNSPQAAATTTTKTNDDNKTKIDPATLPDAVKTTLAGDAYKNWTVTTAWLVNADPVYYTVDLKKDDKNLSVNIDKDGKVK